MGETVIGEFEARRVERMLRGLYAAWLRDDETLQVSGERDGDWLCVCWRLADASGRFVYPVEARVDLRAQRLRLREAKDGAFDLLVLDAFSSDAIPVHLITREAVELYLRKLAPDGWLAFHISNRYLDLEPVLANLATDLRLAALGCDDMSLTAAEFATGREQAHWVVMARDLDARLQTAMDV